MNRRNDNRNCSGAREPRWGILGFSLALFAVLVLLISCSNLFETPASPSLARGMGRVLISLGKGSPRTLMPETPVLAKYTLTFIAPGKTPVQVDIVAETDDTEIAGLTGSGYRVDLEPAVWDLTVTAYTGPNYLLAAKNAEPVSVTITSGVTVNAEVTIAPIPIDGALPGVLSWAITLPALGSSDTAELTYNMIGGTAAAVNLKPAGDPVPAGTVVSGTAKLDSGYYVVKILLIKDGKATGRTGGAQIYPGLETRADTEEFTVFTDEDFAAMKYLAGTIDVTKPDALTLGSVTVEAYTDAACTLANQITTVPGTVTVTGGAWSMKVPVTVTDVYFKLNTSGGGRSFSINTGPESGIPDYGKSGITLPMAIYSVSKGSMANGNIDVTVSGQPAAYAVAGEQVTITLTPAGEYILTGASYTDDVALPIDLLAAETQTIVVLLINT